MSALTSEELMQYLYGWKWNPRKRLVLEELTEEKARKAFVTGPQLAVIALPEPDGVPAYTVQMNAEAVDVRVIHYTKGGSVAANIHYSVPEGEDRLFLEQVGEWLYPDDDEYYSELKAKAFRQYFFKPDGIAEVRSRITGAGAETVEQFSDIDVSDHWVDRVTWGDWDRIGTYQPKAPDS